MRIKIERIGINGEGVALLSGGECDNKVCFIENALPAEEVDVTIVSNKKKFCVAKVNKIISSSPHRLVSPCKYFGVCGGCDIQHMDTSLQMEIKKNNIADTIKKITGQVVKVDNVIRLNDYGYRNKMVFPFANENGKNILGMFEKNTHKVVDIDKCLLASDNLNKFLQLSKDFFKKSNYKGYDFKNKKGDIKYSVARESGDTILVTIVATRKLKLDDYYSYLTKYFSKVGLSLVISNSSDEIMSGKYIHLFGEEYLELEEFGLKYKLDNRGFLQVNNEIKHYLYEYILNEIESNSQVVDAYSGAGLLSAIISKKCREVVGIEINKSASDSAKELAKVNNLKNINFVCGDVKDNLKNVISNFNDCIVVLDPPRAGVDGSILNLINDLSINNMPTSSQNVTDCRIHKIIYISCNPATLARDLKILTHEYNITHITPMDMFPQCRHCEVVTILESKK